MVERTTIVVQHEVFNSLTLNFYKKETHPLSTYDPKQVLTDYANGKLTPEMAVGHSLQHIDKLYEALKANRQEWQAKFDALDKRINLIQTAVDRLTAFMEKFLRKQKRNPSSEQPKT